MRQCSRCVLDNTEDKQIVFDASGVCNHCHSAERALKKRFADKTNLPWIVHQIKEEGIGKEYDCVIGLSGGVDSSMALHYAVQQGLRVFAYSVDNGWNTKESEENIMAMVEGLKVPFYRYTIDVPKFNELQLAFLKSGVANVEIPTDHIITTAAWDMAKYAKSKYIMSGGNVATESIMPASYGYSAWDLYHIKSIYKIFTGKKLDCLPTTSLLQYLKYRIWDRIKIINLLDYFEYNRNDAKMFLRKKYGWIDYGEKHCENMYTNWFQSYYLPKKFGLDKRKPHYSSMINSGQITRDDALKSLKTPPYNGLSALNYKVADGLGINIGELNYIVNNSERHSYKDYPNTETIRKLAYKIYKYF